MKRLTNLMTYGVFCAIAILPAAAQQHLYVGDDNVAGGVQQYTIPVSNASTPNFEVPANSVLSMAINASGGMAVGLLGGNIQFFNPPLSGASVPAATFSNGGASDNGQIAFLPSGDFFAATSSTKVNRFSPPFTNGSTPSQTITVAGTAFIGLGFDAGQNLYLSNSAGGSNLYVYAPPYTGAPVITPLIAGSAYRELTIIGNQLFVGDVSGTLGKVDVYNLPLTIASTPAFSITNGVNTPEGAASDLSNRLYIGNLGNATVTVYTAPFSAASVPVATVTAGSGSFAIFGIATDNAASAPAGSIPAIGRDALIALCALLMVIGLIATRAQS
ncbi:MAG TPA: hypothetical protein VGQ65_05690 [Thermoanaerobaculia bacterium]|jgi:hypothetical protein|nr:hypothetical protein [Thermoanaerobaculia bacterium]